MAQLLPVGMTDRPSKLLGQYLNADFSFMGWLSVIPGARQCPAHVPEEIERIFDEAAKCAAIDAWDAAGTMYRKVLDAATRARTPVPAAEDPTTPSWKVYKDLRLRLDWLFEQNLLDQSLEDLSSCIHQDGNDAAHDVQGIGKHEAQDLGDFTEMVLKSVYTLPGQIAENRRRRDDRRGQA